MAAGKHFEHFCTFSGVLELFEQFGTFLDVYGRFWTLGAIFMQGAIFIIDPLAEESFQRVALGHFSRAI